MNSKDKLDLLEYKVKLLHNIIASLDNFNFEFYSFIIDNDITQHQASLIIKSLHIIKERINHSKVSQSTKDFYSNDTELNILFEDSYVSYKDFEKFINSKISPNLNAKYLLMSLKSQGINKFVCDYLLKSK